MAQESIEIRSLTIITEWLSTINADTDIEELSDALACLIGEEPTTGGLGDSLFAQASELLAYSPDGDSAWLLITDGSWNWGDISYDRALTAVGADGTVLDATLSALDEDARFMIKPGVFFIGEELPCVEELPFAIDGRSWIGTYTDHAFGEGDWVVLFNGEPERFCLRDYVLYTDTVSDVAPGDWLEIGTRGVSMTTGEIGVTVSVDSDGTMYTVTWGYIDQFEGFATTDDVTPEKLLSYALETGNFTMLSYVASDHLTREQMASIAGTIHRSDLDETNPCDIKVRCADWSGTLDDLMGQPPTE